MLSIILNDFRLLWKNKIALALLILAPPVLIIIFASIMSPVFGSNSFIRPFSVAIVDYDDSLGSKMAISSLETEGYISKVVTIKRIGEEEGLNQLKMGETAGVVIIPQGFATSLYEGRNKPLKVYISSQQGINAEMVESFFKGAGDMVIAGQSGIYTIFDFLVKTNISREEAYERTEGWMAKLILISMGRNQIFEKEVVSNIPQVSTVQYYVIGVGVMFIMFTGILGTRLITQDYENGILSRILISPVNKFAYISGKLVTIILLGIIQFISVVIPIALILNTNFKLISLPLFLTVISIIFASAALCILISTFVKSSSNATIASIVSIFIICLAGGCIYPVASMADSLKIVSKFLLSSWAIEGVSLAVTDGDIKRILNVCGTIFISGMLFLLVSIIGIKRRELRFF